MDTTNNPYIFRISLSSTYVLYIFRVRRTLSNCYCYMGSDYRQKGLKSEKGLKITERSQKHYKGLK